MPKPGNPNHHSLAVLKIPAFLLLAVALLFAFRIHSLPTGYLHSWNQIGTLVHVRSIFEDISTWPHPHDVVTRVVWEESLGGVQPGDRDLRYRTFEEFPLYHLLSGSLGKLLKNPILASKLVAVLLYFWGLFFIYKLIPTQARPLDKACVLSVTLCSFPLLYYGQATMSDIGMLSFLTCSVYCISRFVSTNNLSMLVFACLALMTSSLFKSYSIIFAPLLSIGIFIALRNSKRFSTTRFCITSVVASVLSSLPVLAWHYWTFSQIGHHEESSHSLMSKLLSLSSASLYTTLGKIYFRYLGYLGGGALLLYLFFKRFNFPFKPWWLISWLLLSLIYLLLTADKLIDHDYYFLPILPPFLFLCGFAISRLITTSGLPIFASCCVIFSLDFGVTMKSFLKATRESPDVVACAALAEKHLEPNEIFASLTDISRFSSLAYFANRLAINVEEHHFDVQRYRSAGATYLLINLPPQQVEGFSPWIRDNATSLEKIEQLTGLDDFKQRARSCILYKITAEGSA